MLEKMTREEIDRRFAQHTAAVNAGIPITQAMWDSFNDAKKGVRNFSSELRESQSKLTASFGGLIKSTADGATGAAVYNDAIASGAKYLSTQASQIQDFGMALSFIVDVLGTAAQQIIVQADQEFKLFQDLSRSGLANGMNDAFNNLQNAGFTMKEIGDFGKIMKSNSTLLASVGGTAQEGLTKFTKIAADINKSQVGTELMRMGNKIPDIINGMSSYMKYQQLGGQSIAQTDAQIKKNSLEFMFEQDKLTKLTGLTADQQNKIYEEAIGIEQFQAAESQLKEDAIKYKGTARGKEAEAKLAYNKQMLTWAGTIGPEMKKNMALTLGGATNTDGYQTFQRSYSKVGEYMAQGGTDFAKSLQLITTDAKETSKQFGGLARSGDFNKSMGSYQEMLMVRSQSDKDIAKSLKDAADQTTDQKTGKDKTTDNSVKIAQNQRDKAQSIAQVYHKSMGVATSALKQFSIVTKNAWGVLGKLAGKQGQMGGAASGGGLAGILSTTAAGAAAGGAFGAVSGLGIGAVPGAIIGGIAGLGAGILGAFADGGYTGDGGKYEAAGIVHKGEYVIDARTTKSLGLNQSVNSNTTNIDVGLGLSGSTKKPSALGSSRIINTPEDFSDIPRASAPSAPVTDPKNNPALIGIDIQKLNDRINQIQRMMPVDKPSASPSVNFEKSKMRQDAQRDLSLGAIYEQTGETSVSKLTESLDAYQKLMDQVAKQAVGLQKGSNKTNVPTGISTTNTPATSPVKPPNFMDIAFPIPAIVESLSKKITGLLGSGNKPANTPATSLIKPPNLMDIAFPIPSIVESLGKKITGLLGLGNKNTITPASATTPTPSINPKNNSALGASRLINTPEDFSDSPRVKAPLPPVSNITPKVNNVPEYKNLGNTNRLPNIAPKLDDSKKIDTKFNYFQSILNSLNQKINGIIGIGGKVSSPAAVGKQGTAAPAIGSAIPTTEKSQTGLNTTSALPESKNEFSIAGITKLLASLTSYQGILDLSNEKTKKSGSSVDDLYKTYSAIMNNQQKQSDSFTNTLNKSIDPVIKSLSSLTLTTTKLTEMIDELPIENGKDGNSGGMIDQAKSLVSSMMAKFKQTLGFSSGSESGIVGGSGDDYDFGNAPAPSAGGSAGGGGSKSANGGGAAPESPGSVGPIGDNVLSEEDKKLKTEDYGGLKMGSPERTIGGGPVYKSVINSAKNFQSKYPDTIITGLNDKFHLKWPTSGHAQGTSMDISGGVLSSAQGDDKKGKKFVSDLASSGFDGLIIDEYNHPSAAATGGHMHAEVKKPSAARGDVFTPSASSDVLSGPTSGYTVEMHGTEGIVPLKNDKIPVKIKSAGNGSGEKIALLQQELAFLTSIADTMKKQNDVTNRILEKHG